MLNTLKLLLSVIEEKWRTYASQTMNSQQRLTDVSLKDVLWFEADFKAWSHLELAK